MLPNEEKVEFDPEYSSQLFKTRKKLLASITAPTIFPENGLCARAILNGQQFNLVKEIRKRRLTNVMEHFSSD